VKPSHGLQGKAITMNITDEERYTLAIKQALEFTTEEDSGVVVEEQFSGKEYRVLCTRKKVVGIIHRIPANVIGDGVSTVKQLIDKKNSDPRRGKTLDFALFVIEIDANLIENLSKQNLTLESVPPSGQHIRLRSVSNIMQGGDSIDMTDLVHPSVKEIAVKAITAIPGLGFAGVDFMSTDITALQTSQTYIIVEINSSPGLCIHEFPYEGQRRYTDREFLYVLFPELENA
jgi:D-alanine-D-alanine ligase-like ATP-grasp enzyme